MAGIKDYSTTQANNIDLNGISVAEGMLPSNLNNAIRALMKNTREWFNDSQWVEYGDGSGAYTATYASATSFTIAGVDVTPIYHEGRRIKLTATTPGTIYGTISSSSFSTDTTINVTWDSGSLSNEAISNVYIGALSKTNNSLPTGVIATATLADGSVTTVKIAADAVNGSKIADDSIDSEHYVDASIDTQHIADSQITTAKIANANVTTAKIAADAVDGTKIADDSIDSVHYVDGSIDTQHIADSQITTAKIADSNVTTAKIADSNVTTAKIADSNITTAKINDDAVTADKIADAVLVTNAEHSGATPNDTTLFTTLASDSRYFRQDSSETIDSGDTWSASDDFIATTAAIDARVIDLVDDVGGFYPIANETSFPNTNPDVNDGAGTIISIKEIATTRTPTAGVVTISGGTLGGSTVTINGCGSTVLTSGFGVLVETTTTLNTYTFHRLVPKATEVTTVASISSEITTVANDETDIGVVSGLSTDIQALADIEDGTTATNAISNVGNNISSVVTTAANIAGVNSFAERYRVDSSDPSTSLDEGDLAFNTTDNNLKFYNGTSWTAIAPGIANVVDDSTPQLGGNLDLNSNDITGTGDVNISGSITGTTFSGDGSSLTSLNIVTDTTPQLGGDLDLNSNDITGTGNINITGTATATTFSGSGASLTSIPNGALDNSTITINGTPISLGGSVTVGETKPTISSISPDTITNAQTSITITGTNFVIVPQVDFIDTSTGVWYSADTVTFNSSTSLTVQATLSVDGNYRVRIENPDGLSVLSSTALLTVSDAPTWTTAAGSLGSVAQGGAFSTTLVATSDSAITYSKISGTFPTGITLNSSTGVLSGTESGSDTGETTYNFTIRATDAESQTADRAFSITVTVGINNGGQFN